MFARKPPARKDRRNRLQIAETVVSRWINRYWKAIERHRVRNRCNRESRDWFRFPKVDRKLTSFHRTQVAGASELHKLFPRRFATFLSTRNFYFAACLSREKPLRARETVPKEDRARRMGEEPERWSLVSSLTFYCCAVDRPENLTNWFRALSFSRFGNGECVSRG